MTACPGGFEPPTFGSEEHSADFIRSHKLLIHEYATRLTAETVTTGVSSYCHERPGIM